MAFYKYRICKLEGNYRGDWQFIHIEGFLGLEIQEVAEADSLPSFYTQRSHMHPEVSPLLGEKRSTFKVEAG